MTLSVDLFFSFRSPYSYLALPRVLKLVADYDLDLNLRPVYPLAVRRGFGLGYPAAPRSMPRFWCCVSGCWQGGWQRDDRPTIGRRELARRDGQPAKLA
jgi:hypothetical protein